MEKITTLVGRDKLKEWDTLREQQLHEDEALFPRVKPMALGFSIAVFATSLLLPLYPDDIPASNCFSMLLLAICMWVTEALPYYATAVAICPLSIFLGVFKNPDTGDDSLNNGSVMTPSEASTEVYESMWNHTSVCSFNTILSSFIFNIIAANYSYLHRFYC
jgi:phosphate transporter